MTTVEPEKDTSDDSLAELEEAAAERERLRERVEEVGESRLEAIAGAYQNFVRLLERHEESATGYGDFEGYVAFQEELDRFVSGLADDLPAREAFEAADEALQQRRLSADDFAAAREALEPAREFAELYDDWQAAQERYRAARGAVKRRARDLDQRISELRGVLSLGAADLDAPVERLYDPVEAYNEAVRGAFREFKREASAREVFAFLEATRAYPLVDFRRPPTRLREFIAESNVGAESVPTLLEYADYSQSKLSHYVERPHELQRHIATNRTYLERLNAAPLTIEWPPPPASTLRWRARELTAVVGRFAPDEVVARCREVRALTHEPAKYGRLRETAHALAQLDDGERERLRDGRIQRDLERARDKRNRLVETLEAYPEP